MPPESESANPPEVYRTAFGRGLTITVAVLCAATVLFAGVADGLDDALFTLPWVAVVALACWAYFWRPRVEVSDSGVTLVNVTRTIAIPWPALQEIDTQWALRLSTAYGRYAAWAAPAPGLKSAVTSRRLRDVDDVRVLGSPITPWRREGGTASVRPGDLPATSSGDAAAMVRRRWSRLVEAGHLDDPLLERERPVVRWHWDTAAAVVVLIGLGLLTAITVR